MNTEKDNDEVKISSTKINGLKNRIVQRPPPLVLDKVSNFREDEPPQQYNHPTSANHKFWDTLNQNLANKARYANAYNDVKQSSIVAVDSEDLPPGWERAIDSTYGTYYIDHNTQKTQYERPYEIELIKSPIGLGFTLVEADNGALLVKSIISGGPAQLDGRIQSGDILISAVGVSVSGLQHTDVARLFSTFAIGDRITLTFARSAYVVDPNLVPDEYLYSNSTVDMSYHTPYEEIALQQDQNDYEYLKVDLDRGTTDSNWGIRLIGGSEVNRPISIGAIVLGGAAFKNGQLKSGDEFISIDGRIVVGAAHQEVVNLISACSSRTSLVIRRKRFGEACEVVLTRNIDEGFGFVIVSSGNSALIGCIIEGSPADRCQQLHVRDRIIAVNGNFINPSMKHSEIVSMIKECGSTLRLYIIPADCYNVELIKSALNDNFGFSMRGGSEFEGTPLYIVRVAPDGMARDLINAGDQIIEINGIPTTGMTHRQAATIIKRSDPVVKLKLRRNYNTNNYSNSSVHYA